MDSCCVHSLVQAHEIAVVLNLPGSGSHAGSGSFSEM